MSLQAILIDISVARATWERFGVPGPPHRVLFLDLFRPAWKQELHDRFRVEIIGFLLAAFESFSPTLADETDKAVNLICVDSRMMAWTNKQVQFDELRGVVSKYAGRESTDRIEALHVRLSGMPQLTHERRSELWDGASKFDAIMYSDVNREAASQIGNEATQLDNATVGRAESIDIVLSKNATRGACAAKGLFAFAGRCK